MDPEAGEKPAAPRKPRPASEELDWTRENGSLYTYLVCMMLLFFGTLRIAFFPAGRQRQQPLPALVSTLPSDRGFSGPEGDYQATLEALKRVRCALARARAEARLPGMRGGGRGACGAAARARRGRQARARGEATPETLAPRSGCASACLAPPRADAPARRTPRRRLGHSGPAARRRPHARLQRCNGCVARRERAPAPSRQPARLLTDPARSASCLLVIQDVAAAPGSKLVFLGDSITESLRGECGRPGCSDEIPAVWAAEFAPHQALALGVSGDRTENLLWRLEQGETAGLAPKLTVVEIGTNNLAFGHSAEATAFGVQAVVRSVREKLPGSRVAVQLLLPRSKDRGDFTPWHDVDVVNEMLWEALRGTPGVSIVDCTKPFLKDGLVDEALMPDGLHPNADGVRAWAKCLNKVFKRFLDPLPGGPTSPIALDLGAVA
jgi:lysophospholipase L1-like esterase